MKDERPRRKREDAPVETKTQAAEEIKSGVAAIESAEVGVEKKEAVVAAPLSDEELEKKLAQALESDAKDA